MQPTAVPPTFDVTGGDAGIAPGMTLPLPDDAAGAAARQRLVSVDIGVSAPTIAALGLLAEAVVFVASVQGSPYPRPLLSTRVVLLTGTHAGGAVAGPAPDPRNGMPLQHLAVAAGAGIVTLEWQPAAAAIELEDAITPEQMESALRAGWMEAERAADEGIELLVLAAGGAGAATAAAAVIAAVTGAEPTALLGRVVTPAGLYDDNAWMTRCLALRDALHRVRDRDPDPRTVLAALGGADIAAATGLLLGAASRRTPVMVDGPVGAAAALLANDFSPQARRWLVFPDAGRRPAVRLAAEALELRPWLDLCLDLGEGAASLASLPVLQMALTLAGVGEAVEPSPLTHYDSSGNQVFVGVAKAIEPAEDAAAGDAAAADETEVQAMLAATVENAALQSGDSAQEPGETAEAPPPADSPAADAVVDTPTADAVVDAPAADAVVDTPAADAVVDTPTASTGSTDTATVTPTVDKEAPDTADNAPLDTADKAAADNAPLDTADKAAADKAAADKAAADKVAADKVAPGKVPATKPTPARAAGKTGAVKAPTKAAATKAAKATTPAKATPAKDPAAKDPAAKDTFTKDPAAKDTSAKNGDAKDTVAKDTVAKDNTVAKDTVAKAPTGRPGPPRMGSAKAAAGEPVRGSEAPAKEPAGGPAPAPTPPAAAAPAKPTIAETDTAEPTTNPSEPVGAGTARSPAMTPRPRKRP